MNKYWWSDDEEGSYHGPFNNKDEAINAAYIYRAKCFEDPSQSSGFYLTCGYAYPNPEFDHEHPHHDFNNPKMLISGNPTFFPAIEVTDYFYSVWDKLKEVTLHALEVRDGQIIGSFYLPEGMPNIVPQKFKISLQV